MTRTLDRILQVTQKRLGPLNSETQTAVVGFAAGGPVGIVEARDKLYFVTSELSETEGAVRSKEGLRYELALKAATGPSYAQQALTFLARHFMNVPIGAGEMISLGKIDDKPAIKADISLIKVWARNCGCYVITPRRPELIVEALA